MHLNETFVTHDDDRQYCNFALCRPVIPEEELEEEAIEDDDAEVTVNKVEEEMIVRVMLQRSNTNIRVAVYCSMATETNFNVCFGANIR